MNIKLGIVIPAYNEQKRLPQTLKNLRSFLALKGNGWDVREVLVVNDGSKDATSEFVQEIAKDWPLLQLIEFRQNLGKGAACFAGLQALHKKPVGDESVDYILIADADEATPWSELLSAFSAAQKNPDCFLIFGSRRHPKSDILSRQQWWREKLGRLFNLLLRVLSGVPFKDTQCGFKLFRNDQRLTQILNEWTVARFAWDAEVLLNALASGMSCEELAIQWRHVEESRVHPVKDGLQMASEILRIRVRRLRMRLQKSLPKFRESALNHSAGPLSKRVNSQIILRSSAITDADRSKQNS